MLHVHVGPYCHLIGCDSFLFPLGFNPGLSYKA